MNINILWTGGWDSTFRLLQLLERGEDIIQPYYIIDENRESSHIEKEKMQEIILAIKEKWPQNFANLRETIFINKADIPIDSEISQAYKELKKESFIGEQYDWLGRLSKQIGELELCVHKDDKAYYFLEKYVKKDENGIYCIDNEKTTENISKVYGNFRYALLDYTKIDMMNEAKANNFYDIMLKTWFCFTPIDGEPCGVCNPCQYSIDEGMSFRFSKKALLRNKFRLMYKVKRKLMKTLKK